MGRQGTELGASPVTVSSGDSGEGLGCGGPHHGQRIQVGDAAGGDTTLHSLLPGCRAPASFCSTSGRLGSFLGSASGSQGPWNSNLGSTLDSQ